MAMVGGLATVSAEGREVRYEDLARWLPEQNGQVAGALREAEAADVETGHLLRSFLPRVGAELGWENFRTGPYDFQSQPTASLGASLNLFRGGRDALEHQLRGEKSELAKVDAQRKLRTELRLVRRDYWDLIYLQESIRLVKDAIEQNAKNLAAAKRRVGAGMGAETDRYEFEIYQTQLEQELARLELQQKSAERKLGVALGVPVEERLQVVEPPHEHGEGWLPEGLTPEADLSSQGDSLQERIFDLQGAQAGRWWAPELDVYAHYSLYTFREREYPSQADRFETVFGAKLTFTLFDGLAQGATARADRRRAEAFRLRANQAYVGARVDFENARAQLKLTHDLVHGTERNVEQSQKYLHGTLSEYQRGLKNSPDVLSASQRYLEARRKFSELKREYNWTKADLMSMLGR